MPITSALALESAPPELPGLIGASVWMRFVRATPSAPETPSMLRARPDTIPRVTEFS